MSSQIDLAPHQAAFAAVKAAYRAEGFEYMLTGGGCDGFAAARPDPDGGAGFYVLVTSVFNESGAPYFADEPVLVGLHDSEGGGEDTLFEAADGLPTAAKIARILLDIAAKGDWSTAVRQIMALDGVSVFEPTGEVRVPPVDLLARYREIRPDWFAAPMGVRLEDLHHGMRVELTAPVGDYPLDPAPKGARGTVVEIYEGEVPASVWIRLDEHFAQLDEWSNRLQVSTEGAAYPDGSLPLRVLTDPVEAYGLAGFEGFNPDHIDECLRRHAGDIDAALDGVGAFVLVTGVSGLGFPGAAEDLVLVGLHDSAGPVDLVRVEGGAVAAAKAAGDLVRIHARDLRYRAKERGHDTEEALVAELGEWSALHGLDPQSADEMLCTEQLRQVPDRLRVAYLSRFIMRWDDVMAREEGRA